MNGTGVTVTSGYDAGRHNIDLCLEQSANFQGVEVDIHPDGPDAHVRRHMELQDGGWPLISALHPRWQQHPGELAIRLAQLMDDLTPSTF